MTLHHEIIGRGPALFVLHGLLGSLANWRSVARALADLRTIVLADLRSHGRSPHHPELTLAAMSQDVAELMSTLGHQSADVLGHSLGGKIAMQLAVTSAARVRSLIVLDIGPRRAPAMSETPLAACMALDLVEVKTREEAVRRLQDAVGTEALARWLAMNLEREPTSGRLRWRIPLAAIHAALPALSSDVSSGVYGGRALFLRGERSGYVTDADLPAIRSMFPAATVETVENAGHWLHQDAFDAVVQRLRKFLS
ncbi:MAG TPA: alpha/beta fold hydrolase [Candidatus Limnocylindrales bacterium]|nr:alpha/beta fold hydrolase [Candidatus Limnocylindrales bacterium]